jgi:hypothetical protein
MEWFIEVRSPVDPSQLLRGLYILEKLVLFVGALFSLVNIVGRAECCQDVEVSYHIFQHCECHITSSPCLQVAKESDV